MGRGLLISILVAIATITAPITGNSFTQLTNDTAVSDQPHAAVDGSGNVHLVWADDRDSTSGTLELYYKMFNSSFGTTYIGDTRITDLDGNYSLRPYIAMDSQGRAFIVWQDKRSAGAGVAVPQVYLMRLDPAGVTWDGSPANLSTLKAVADTRISIDVTKQLGPVMAVDSSDEVHVVWESANPDYIWYRKFDGSGAELISNTILNSAATGVNFYHPVPTVLIDSNDNAHVIWNEDHSDTQEEIYYTMIDGSSGSVMIAQTPLTENDGYTSNRQHAAMGSSDTISLVWQDKRAEATGGAVEVYYMKLDPALAATNGSAAILTDLQITTEIALTADDGIESFLPYSSYFSDGNIHLSFFGQSASSNSEWPTPKDYLNYLVTDTSGTVQVGPSMVSDTSFTSTGWSGVTVLELSSGKYLISADSYFGNPEIVARSVNEDLDSDGYTPVLSDCNDVDATINPDGTETCDGADQNCNGQIDEGDPGGGGACDTGQSGVCAAGTITCVAGTLDCIRDTKPSSETCDGLDNDCDGTADEGLTFTTYYADADGDGYGSAVATTLTCLASPPSGYVADSNDCADADSTVNPDASEICGDTVDNDCSASTADTWDGDFDGYSCDLDCNDGNVNINPGSPEICNDGINNDCDALTLDLADNDDDGYTCATDCNDDNALMNPGLAEICNDGYNNDCDAGTLDLFDGDSDGSSCDADCDDGDAATYPGADEICDGLDNDCNSLIDDGLTTSTFYADTDDDDFGNALASTQSCLVSGPDDYVADSTDCDDTRSAVNPGLSEVCGDSLDNDCNGSTPDTWDGDSDTFTCDVDCNDADSTVNPGVSEICGDGINNDCDLGTPDEVDGDNDGFTCNDCDDGDATVYPGADEICDGQDNDCGGVIDEGFDGDSDGWTTCAGDCNDGNSSINPSVSETCNGVDDDCDEIVDNGFDSDVDGMTTCAGDCDDGDVTVYAGASETCDGKDNDCDTDVDEGFDTDSDGWTTCAGDCVDSNGSINPDVTETCNGVDDDCDTIIDNGFDADDDGWTTCNGDCDDTDISISPGATESCNGIDDDCDTIIDNGYDTDTDGWTTCAGDCDDSDGLINPDGTEICNGEDDNCDTVIDEGFDTDSDGWTSCDGDCDDTDPDITPVDGDLDGYSVCDDPPDCDDTDAFFNPGDDDFDGVSTCDGDTNAGSDITTIPQDPTTGTTPVLVTFGLVTMDFQTTLAIADSGFAPPSGFVSGTGQTWLEISTTMQAYSGTVEVCFTYDDTGYADESVLKLFHDASGDGTWIDITTTIDTVSDTICGEVASLSTFAAFQAEPTSSGGGGGGGGCFIATAAYGSYQAPTVQLLRDFRDDYLLTNTPGRWFVAQYYHHSPPMADWIRDRDSVKALVRILLLPLIGVAWMLLNLGPIELLLVMLLPTLVVIASRYRPRLARQLTH